MLKNAIDRMLEKSVGYRLVKHKTNSLSGPLTFQDLLNFHLTWTHVPGRDCFVQIGANDGITKDPLRDAVIAHRMRGVLVEPQTGPFERLRENYAACPGLTFVNAAVGEMIGDMQLWRIKDSFESTYSGRSNTAASGIASFDKRHVIRHLLKNATRGIRSEADAERYIESVIVPVIPLNRIIAEHLCGELQILQLDTEGHDYRILQSLDFESYRPRIINYESKHLSGDEMGACEALLHEHGYLTFGHGSDTCGLLVRPP